MFCLLPIQPSTFGQECDGILSDNLITDEMYYTASNSGELQSVSDISKTNNLRTKQLVKIGSLHNNYPLIVHDNVVSVSWHLYCIFVDPHGII